MTLYLRDATYIDWQTLAFQSAHMAVQPGLDGGIELLEKLPPASSLEAGDTVLDCHQRLVTKGLTSVGHGFRM